jgi:hypothetical protein
VVVYFLSTYYLLPPLTNQPALGKFHSIQFRLNLKDSAIAELTTHNNKKREREDTGIRIDIDIAIMLQVIKNIITHNDDGYRHRRGERGAGLLER